MEEGDLLVKQNQNEKSTSKKWFWSKRDPLLFTLEMMPLKQISAFLYFVISGFERFAFTPVPSSFRALHKGIRTCFSPLISPLFSQCLSLLSLLV